MWVKIGHSSPAPPARPPRTAGPGRRLAVWLAHPLICAVTALAYLVTGVAKVAGPLGWSWATGEAMRSQVAADAIRKEVLGDAGSPLFYVLFDQVWLFTILGAVSLALELGAPVALLNRRLGQWWALGAFLMHWGILFIMGIKFHYHLSGIPFASFFDVDRLAAWWRALPARASVWAGPGTSFNPQKERPPGRGVWST